MRSMYTSAVIAIAALAVVVTTTATASADQPADNPTQPALLNAEDGGERSLTLREFESRRETSRERDRDRRRTNIEYVFRTGLEADWLGADAAEGWGGSLELAYGWWFKAVALELYGRASGYGLDQIGGRRPAGGLGLGADVILRELGHDLCGGFLDTNAPLRALAPHLVLGVGGETMYAAGAEVSGGLTLGVFARGGLLFDTRLEDWLGPGVAPDLRLGLRAMASAHRFLDSMQAPVVPTAFVFSGGLHVTYHF